MLRIPAECGVHEPDSPGTGEGSRAFLIPLSMWYELNRLAGSMSRQANGNFQK